MKKGLCLLLALVLCICSFPVFADSEGDEQYQNGLALMKQEKYYSAYLAFLNSSDGRAAEMAEKCIQPWPRTGELWHDNSLKHEDMELTIKVNQADDEAFFARIIKNKKTVSMIFIGGSGSVTVTLPGAQYSIKDCSGTDWFGTVEYFGRHGHYETMLFNDGSDKVYLRPGYAWTITVNVTETTETADKVEHDDMNWADFME